MARLVLGGDTMLGRLVDSWTVAKARSPLAPIQPMLAQAELRVVNLECALTAGDTWYQGPEKAFYFRGRPAAAAMLAEAGVGLVQLANNHALDAGMPGLIDTLDLLDGHGIGHAGAGVDLAAARRPAICEYDGLRVALLAWCDHQPDFAATATQPGIYWLDVDDLDATCAALAADIAAARALADLVVVGCHWQHNWENHVRPPYLRIARACLEAGASVVWGHGPHHFQGVAWHGEGVVLYSTGDLVDDYAIDPSWRNDLQLLFTVVIEAGRPVRVEARPLAIRDCAVHPASEEEAAWIARRFATECAAVGTQPVQAGGVLVVSR